MKGATSDGEVSLYFTTLHYSWKSGHCRCRNILLALNIELSHIQYHSLHLQIINPDNNLGLKDQLDIDLTFIY